MDIATDYGADPVDVPEVVSYDMYTEIAASVKFKTWFLRMGLDYYQEIKWNTETCRIGDVLGLGEPQFIHIEQGDFAVVLKTPELLIYINWEKDPHRIAVQVGSLLSQEKIAIEFLQDFQLRFPEMEPRGNKVPVHFWFLTKNGPSSASRFIEGTEWDEVQANYAAATKAELDHMITKFKPSHGGQLVLWHGVAGTGKTWGIRALMHEWNEHFKFEYITDPDAFFENAAYMMQVLLSGHQDINIDDDDIDDDDSEEEELPKGKWRLLIMEDTGELLSADAKEREGQKLSRLLNLVDGLIGQGLRIILLITTNEELKTLHPAVTRPGRCAGLIEFHHLSHDEAVEFLKAHGVTDPTPSSRNTLAELYGIIEEFDQRGLVKPAPGFVR